MSVCNTCLNSKPIPKCTDALVLGTADPTTAYYVYIKDCSINYTERLSATTDGAGLLTVDISTLELLPTHAYEIWITKQTETNASNKESFTIDSTIDDCINLTVFEDDQTYTSQTIKQN